MKNDTFVSIRIADSEFVKEELEIVLGAEAGVEEVAFDFRPVVEAVIVVHLQFVGYDERNVAVTKAFTEHY